MMCICDICKTEVEDSYDGRIGHIQQFHPLNLGAQMVAEIAAPVGNLFADILGRQFNHLSNKPKRQRRRNRRNRR